MNTSKTNVQKYVKGFNGIQLIQITIVYENVFGGTHLFRLGGVGIGKCSRSISFVNSDQINPPWYFKNIFKDNLFSKKL